MFFPKFLSRKISPEKSLDFLSQKSVLRPALHFPHELVVSSMAGKSAGKSQKRRGPSLDINPAQATHL